MNAPLSLLLAAAGLIVACGAAPQPTPPPVATPAPRGPRVTMPSGAVYGVEIARTPEAQTQGLMFRESLAPKTGMIFLFTDGGAHHFWMKNTMIPLDIIWLDAAGNVVFVSTNTPPCKSDPCPTYGPDRPAPIILELAGGMAAKEGVQAGATLKIEDVR